MSTPLMMRIIFSLRSTADGWVYRSEPQTEKERKQELSSCWDGRSFGHNRHGPKSWGGGCCDLFRGELGPHLTLAMSFGPRPTSVPSGILICPTVWSQYINVTDSSGQRSDSRANRFTNGSPQKLKTPNRLAQEIWTNCARLSIRLWLTMSEYSQSFHDIVAWRRWKLVTRLYRPSVENLCQHYSVTV